MGLNEDVFEFLKGLGIKLITAESLTGGLISAKFTEIPGASEVFWGGFSVYSPEAKINLLGVDPLVIENYGIVSLQTAEAMSLGALRLFLGDKKNKAVSVAVTGIAGPGGGTEDCPVGTVCIGLSHNLPNDVKIFSKRFLFLGNRDEVREKTVLESFRLILDLCSCFVETGGYDKCKLQRLKAKKI